MTSKPSRKLLTTLEVEAIINGLGGQAFTTREIAEIAEATKAGISTDRIEYSVRAAIHWLMERGKVVRWGVIIRPSPRCYPYQVTTYRAVMVAHPVDFATLYRTLGMVV